MTEIRIRIDSTFTPDITNAARIKAAVESLFGCLVLVVVESRLGRGIEIVNGGKVLKPARAIDTIMAVNRMINNINGC